MGTKENKTGETASEFVRQYERLMYKVAWEYADSQAECEDIVQEALVSILKVYDMIRGLGRNRKTAYVATVVKHQAINHAKRKEREGQLVVASMDDVEFTFPAGGFGYAEPIELLSESVVAQALCKLPAAERYLIEGKYIIGLTDAELAAELNCQPQSIRMKLTKARRKLAEELEKLGERV